MKRNLLIGVFGTICAFAIITSILLYNGIIWFNNPSQEEYPISGVDVSAYQGIINWDMLSRQNIDFAFIKATEGSSFQDEKFNYNWENANKTQLKIGAYHFFSYDSSGSAQADNFISIVPNQKGDLPPVVDIEFYGDKGKNPLSREKTNPILDELLSKLELYYQKRPIIYATKKSYDLYIKNKYSDHIIWIRDVIRRPTLSDEREWTFWQYSNREFLKGYNGKEKYIDMNVFKGTKEEFKNLY